MQYSVKGLKADLRAGIKHSYHLFCGGLLSNNYPCKFTIDGVKYCCGVQFLEAQKAKVFQNDDVYEEIMNARNESEVLKCSNKLTNYDEVVWKQHFEEYAMMVLQSRVSSDSQFREYIKNIKEDIIVYSNKDDLISGNGLTMFDTNANNPLYWDGSNLWGFCVMQMRDKLTGKELNEVE